jgi:plastocyanin
MNPRRPSTAAVATVAAIAIAISLHVAVAQPARALATSHGTIGRHTLNVPLNAAVRLPASTITPELKAQSAQPASVVQPQSTQPASTHTVTAQPGSAKVATAQPGTPQARTTRRQRSGATHPKALRTGAGAHAPGGRADAHQQNVRHDKAHSAPDHVRAHAAGDPSATIADFKFSPGTITVHVGDTITWTNNGPSSHTATAQNGSFNTGVLKKGASASHTFEQAGTFAYICQIHPFMHGTVVVLANAPAPAQSPPPAKSAAPAPAASSGSFSHETSSTTPHTAATHTSTTTPSGQALPVTGLTMTAPLLCGIVLLGLGLVLRARTARHPSPPRDQ